MDTLTELVNHQTQLERTLTDEERAWGSRRRELEGSIAETKRLRAMAACDLDLDLIAVAEKIVGVTGLCNTSREFLVDEAAACIATNGEKIRHEFFGIKNIVFAVGLRRDYRRELTAEEIAAALYLLEHFKAGRYVSPGGVGGIA